MISSLWVVLSITLLAQPWDLGEVWGEKPLPPRVWTSSALAWTNRDPEGLKPQVQPEDQRLRSFGLEALSDASLEIAKGGTLSPSFMV